MMIRMAREVDFRLVAVTSLKTMTDRKRCNADIHPSSTFIHFGSNSTSQLLLNRLVSLCDYFSTSDWYHRAQKL
jgi:hypothetical protein